MKYNDYEEAEYLYNRGANPDYILPAEEKSARELAKEMLSNGTFDSRFIHLLNL